jgi:hypothetical protein
VVGLVVGVQSIAKEVRVEEGPAVSGRVAETRPPEEVDKEACSQASGDKGPVHMDSRQWRISLSKLAEAWVMEAGGVTRVEKLNLHQEAQSRRSNKPV